MMNAQELFKRCANNQQIKDFLVNELGGTIDSVVTSMIVANRDLHSCKLDFFNIVQLFYLKLNICGIPASQGDAENFLLNLYFPMLEKAINEDIEDTTKSYEKIVAFSFKEGEREGIITYGNRCYVKAEKIAFEKYGFAMYSR